MDLMDCLLPGVHDQKDPWQMYKEAQIADDIYPIHCEYLIIGGGIMGAACAYWLGRFNTGAPIVVVERDPSFTQVKNEGVDGALGGRNSSAIFHRRKRAYVDVWRLLSKRRSSQSQRYWQRSTRNQLQSPGLSISGDGRGRCINGGVTSDSAYARCQTGALLSLAPQRSVPLAQHEGTRPGFLRPGERGLV